MMALSIALSVVATIGTGILLSSRIIYGMANYRDSSVQAAHPPPSSGRRSASSRSA
jgi:hypothetical protein